MLDTVRYTQKGYLKENPKAIAAGWRFSDYVHPKLRVPISFAVHDPSDLKIDSFPNGLTFQVSLPRILFGSNRRLIKSDAEIARAYKKADALTALAAITTSPRTYKRIDLAWQFEDDIAKYVRTFRLLRHPRVLKKKLRWYRTSLLWPGTSIAVKIYGKCEEQCAKAKLSSRENKILQKGKVVRFEVELKNKKDILHVLSGKSLPDFENCRKMFCIQFFKFFRLGMKRKLTPMQKMIFALATSKKWRDLIPAKVALDSLGPKARRKAQDVIAPYMLRRHGIDLYTMFKQIPVTHRKWLCDVSRRVPRVP